MSKVTNQGHADWLAPVSQTAAEADEERKEKDDNCRAQDNRAYGAHGTTYAHGTPRLAQTKTTTDPGREEGPGDQGGLLVQVEGVPEQQVEPHEA